MNIICKIKGHKRGKTRYNKMLKSWTIRCARCGDKLSYVSPWCRLVGLEIKFGFDGK